jgi:hypothetical protein
MKRINTALALLTASLASAETPLINPKVYVGSDGLRATVALVKPAAQGRCVLLVTGSTLEIDSLALPCSVHVAASGGGGRQWSTYKYVKRGRDQPALECPGDSNATLNGPLGVSFKLAFSDDETKKLNLDKLWAQHQTQLASPEAIALARFDRAAEVAEGAALVAGQLAETNTACGTKLKATADWSAASEQVFKNAAYVDGCRTALVVLQSMCTKWKSARAAFAEKLTDLKCTYGVVKPAKASVSGKTLNIITSDDEFIDQNVLEAYLKEVL